MCKLGEYTQKRPFEKLLGKVAEFWQLQSDQEEGAGKDYGEIMPDVKTLSIAAFLKEQGRNPGLMVTI